MQPELETSGLSVSTPGGRRLIEGLNLRIGREHVALVGRNGVGKSTLLAVLAGVADAGAGRVTTRTQPHFLPQADERTRARSLGEQRRLSLSAAQKSGAEILLLDEPSEHLDHSAQTWLRDWLSRWPGCLIVASHDRRLLGDFRHFFVLSESGCRYFGGALGELEAELELEHQRSEQRYVQNLNRLAAEEERALHVARRKARKKRYGRCSELDRATPRIRLNQKRDHAQVSQGRLAKLREARLASLRHWTQSTRRALNVSLPLELTMQSLPAEAEEPVLTVHAASAGSAERRLFESLDLRLGRERVGVVGPNGAGKTTLLEILLGRRQPDAGSAQRVLSKIGYVAQGGTNFLLDESLLAHLTALGASSEASAELLLRHKFPLALGERPLRSLSPGERARAALISLFAKSPAVELLILDEPTFSLDLLGQRALTRALQAWPGGLVIASHDSQFLAELALDRVIDLGA
jgi:ATPase subunit of ABC transporter with duplicated ATPase domains